MTHAKRVVLSLAVLASLPAAAAEIAGTIKVADPAEADRTVVYVESVPGAAVPPKQRLRLSQKGARFTPTVLPVVQGTEVDMTNDDIVTHNVFSKAPVKTFDLGLYSKEERNVVKFDKPGVVPIFCSIHPRMNATVVVLQNPFFAKPDERGTFRINGVPAGQHTLKVFRHGHLEPIAVRKVSVPASGKVSVKL